MQISFKELVLALSENNPDIENICLSSLEDIAREYPQKKAYEQKELRTALKTLWNCEQHFAGLNENEFFSVMLPNGIEGYVYMFKSHGEKVFRIRQHEFLSDDEALDVTIEKNGFYVSHDSCFGALRGTFFLFSETQILSY